MLHREAEARPGRAVAPPVRHARRSAAPRALAVARALWLARDEYAREVDIAPGRLVPDSSLVAAAPAQPADQARPRRR